MIEAKKMEIPPSNIFCTGDVVAYCAQPEECVQIIKEWGIYCIAGNVELQLGAGKDDCACDFESGGRCDAFSKKWYSYAQESLSQDSIKWMQMLPEFISFNYAGKKVVIVHGSYHNTSEFIFESTDWEVKKRNFKDVNADVVLAGHCGLPFSQKINENYWLNAGVIGMPANDGTPRVWYLLLDDDNNFSFKHITLDYDYKKAKQLMEERDLTLEYAKTLETGLWDNCEILPERETRLQGKNIVF